MTQTIVTVAASAAGIALIGLAVRDIWHTLFHPAARGTLNRLVARAVWSLGRRLTCNRPTALTLAGPSALTSVVAVWGLLLVVGWALIYWPHLPEAFLNGTGLAPSETSGTSNRVSPAATSCGPATRSESASGAGCSAGRQPR